MGIDGRTEQLRAPYCWALKLGGGLATNELGYLHRKGDTTVFILSVLSALFF